MEELATKKMNATVEKLKQEGWAWVEQRPDDYTYRSKCGRIFAKKGNTFDAEEMKNAGCFLVLSQDWKLEVDRGIVKPEDKRKLTKAKDAAAKGKAEPVEKSISQSLLLSLRSFRLRLAEVALASKPDLAYDLMVYCWGRRETAR